MRRNFFKEGEPVWITKAICARPWLWPGGGGVRRGAVGCVIVRDGQVIGRGRNRREEKQHTGSHAEMEAICQANEALGTWRLDDCTLYVTLEPCPMCAGAILNARIPRVYYGARDREMGACGAC